MKEIFIIKGLNDDFLPLQKKRNHNSRRKRHFSSYQNVKKCSPKMNLISIKKEELLHLIVWELLAFLLGHKPQNFNNPQRVRRIENSQKSFVRSNTSGLFDLQEPKKEVKKGLKFRSWALKLKFYRWLVQPLGTMKIENLTKISGFFTWSDAQIKSQNRA